MNAAFELLRRPQRAILFLLLPMLGRTALAQTSAPAASDTVPLPPQLQGVGIDEQLNGVLPLDAAFTASSGRQVRLRDYFDGKHPVILTLNYYRCPMLCTLQLNALVSALKRMDWTAGDQFKIVTVSFDPLETSELAAAKQQVYLAEYDRPQAARGWAFLTGHKPSVDALLGATGVHVKWNEKQQQWMHATILILCTPDGRISRYLRNIAYDPKTLRLSLVEASAGKIGTTVDHLLLLCCTYDPQQGTYALTAWNVVRLSATLVAVAITALLLVLWGRGRAARKAARGVPV
jgi:protein SCO1/2